MRFKVLAKEILQVKDAGGAVTAGPFVPGIVYERAACPDKYFQDWLYEGKVEPVR